MPNIVNQNPQFINSYFSALLEYKSFADYMWDYDAAELQAFMAMRKSDFFGASIPTMTPDGSFNTPIKNVQLNQAIIATATQNGAGLDLTFTDPTISTFYESHKVEDSLGFEGVVFVTAPGAITIMPFNNPSTLTAGTYFQNGTIIRDTGFIATTFNSLGDKTLYDTKDVQQDWTEISRADAQIARRENVNIFQLDTTGEEEVFYGYYQTEADTFNRFMYNTNRKIWFGKGGTNLNVPAGTASKTMGIRNRIIQDSGNYITTGAEIDQANFENMILQAAAVNPNYGQNIKLFPGIRAARKIGQFYPSQTAFAAATKKQDGKSLSISLQTADLYVAGVNVEVVLNFGFLNSKKIQDFHKDSVYAINMAPTTMNGRPAKLMQLIHSSDDSNSTNANIRFEITGTTSSKQGNNIGAGMINQNQITSTPVDGTHIGFLADDGVSFVADGSGLFEYPH